MSANSSILRAIACAGVPLPSTKVDSGGVHRRQSQRANARSAPTARVPGSITRTISVAPIVPGVISAHAIATIPDQTPSVGNSSIVRWRMARWSLS